jgi:hypothetical protein
MQETIVPISSSSRPSPMDHILIEIPAISLGILDVQLLDGAFASRIRTLDEVTSPYESK